VDWQTRTAYVVPTQEPGLSRWLGEGAAMGFELCQMSARVRYSSKHCGERGADRGRRSWRVRVSLDLQRKCDEMRGSRRRPADVDQRTPRPVLVSIRIGSPNGGDPAPHEIDSQLTPKRMDAGGNDGQPWSESRTFSKPTHAADASGLVVRNS
jgi:hypothetical protein